MRHRILAAFLVLSTLLLGQGTDPMTWATPQHLVTDVTGTLSKGDARYLENKLLDYADTTSTQIAIVIIPTTGGDEINLFTAELAEKWKIGQDGKDNGCLILLAKDDREISIQNGYGLEPYLTDATSRMIIENEMLPYFKQGEFARGLDAGTTAIMQVLAGSYEGSGGRNSREAKRTKGLLKAIIFFILIAIIISRNNKGGNGGRRIHGGMGPFWWGYGGGYTMGGGHHRGGGFGGGGFGGGGFGGFGGGSFGGGGASGSW